MSWPDYLTYLGDHPWIPIALVAFIAITGWEWRAEFRRRAEARERWSACKLCDAGKMEPTTVSRFGAAGALFGVLIGIAALVAAAFYGVQWASDLTSDTVKFGFVDHVVRENRMNQGAMVAGVSVLVAFVCFFLASGRDVLRCTSCGAAVDRA